MPITGEVNLLKELEVKLEQSNKTKALINPKTPNANKKYGKSKYFFNFSLMRIFLSI